MMDQDELILGVDGGGSKTVAWLACRDHPDTHPDIHPGRVHVIGRGRSGPSNCRSVSIAQATENLDRAIDSAFDDAKRTRSTVHAACIALAGADRPVEQKQIRSWAAQRNLADQLTITNDAEPLLYAVANDGVGIALISGTGSLALGRNAQGEMARCGGWGGLFGDEGSGYQIAIAALRATAHAADGRGPQTALLQGVLDHFNISKADELVPIIYSERTDRSTIAKLAAFVFQFAAAGDEVSGRIVDQAATDLQNLVVTLARRLGMTNDPLSLAVTGGVLLHQPSLLAQLHDRLTESGLRKVTITPVKDAAAGAIVIAQQLRPITRR